MGIGYNSAGIFLGAGEGSGLQAGWNPHPTGGHFAGWNPHPTGGHFAGWNPHPTGGHFAGWNPNPTGGHFAAWNPNPTGGHLAGWNPNPTGGNDHPPARSELRYEAATGSPWPWRQFDPPWTYGGGPALLGQALRKVRSRLIGERDLRRPKAEMGQVSLPAHKNNPLWRWGSEFRQQAVVAELLSRTVVHAGAVFITALDFKAKAAQAVVLPLFELRAPAQGFDYSTQIDKVLRAAVEREERLPEILTQAVDFRPFFRSLCGLDRAATPHLDELLLVAWAWATHLLMVLKCNVAEFRPVQRSSLVMPVIGTPAHGSMPSGHATVAALTAALLAELLYESKGARVQLLHRLAARIAFNRVVAGVHFPMDSLVGRELGAQLARLLVGIATASDSIPAAVKVRVQADSQWAESDAPAAPGGPPAAGQAVRVAVPALAAMWRAAGNELQELGFQTASSGN